MNAPQSFFAFAIEARMLPEMRAVLEAAGRPDLARVLIPEDPLAANPYQVAVIRSARRQVEHSDTLSIPDAPVIIPGEFAGDRLVLSWVRVDSNTLTTSLVAQTNAIAVAPGTELWSARRSRGQFMLLVYPFSQEVMGSDEWVEDHHNESLLLTIWSKDPDHPFKLAKGLFGIRFRRGTAEVEEAAFR
jgi:hypothetical protein